MIQELVEFGRKLNEGKSRALKEELFAIDLVIDEHGRFLKFIPGERKSILAENITAKKGKARLILDKCEEVLGVGEKADKKHQLFMEKLEQYRKVHSLQPVFSFYEDKNGEGLTKARDSFSNLDKKTATENITFMVGTTRLLDMEDVKAAIIEHFEAREKDLSDGKRCSVCGRTAYPVVDEPHGMVRMPKGQTAGSALVSYNEAAFESYGLKGNLNSSICRSCARNYIAALDFMLSDGHEVKEEKSGKTFYRYSHRYNISDSTVALFWTRQAIEDIDPFSMFDAPDASEVRNLYSAIWSGNSQLTQVIDTNMFYSCTLSSAAARIAVRDWTAISLDAYKRNIAEWFKDIEIVGADGEIVYSSLRAMIRATQKDKRSGDKKQSDAASKTRIGTALWNSAIKGRSFKLPLEMMQYVLARICKGDFFSPERAAIIKLILTRNTDKEMKTKLDNDNNSMAYLCGRLFAIVESMQWKAVGNVNSGLKERYFAAAAAQPATILSNLLVKNVPIYQHKIKGYLAKELNEIAGRISMQGKFPPRFTTVEQGEFALGYYFQKMNKPDVENKDENKQ